MSSTSSIRTPIPWSNVDVFTFGKTSLYGYDLLNHCLIVQCLTELNNISNDRYHLSSSPTWPIRRLILNQDETILALLADKIAYLVHLPQSNNQISKNSPSKGSRLCPIIRVPPSISSSTSINCSLIDFVWLTSNHFVIVYSIPSSSECHLYTIRPSKQDGIEHIQTFSVGLSSSNKSGTPSKKISLHQPSDIIKLNITKRKDEEDREFLLLLAMKSDGDIYLLEINPNELSSENIISSDFQGPIHILPSTFDNYGADHGQSTFISLSNSILPLVIFTRDRSQLHQCIILSPSVHQYYLFTIDSISLSTDQNGEILTLILPDPYSSNRYFISDSIANVYSIEISWIDQIHHGLKQFQPTYIQHLIHGTNSNHQMTNKIEQMGVIQTNNHEQSLAIIVKSQINQQKELILVHLHSSESNEKSKAYKSEFVDHIQSLLSREQSIPFVTLSTPSSSTISHSDLETNLTQFMKIFTEQYIKKQEKVRQEIDNKQRYLADFHQTQINENKQLSEKFQQIQKQFQSLTGQYQQECSRRKRLSTHVDDLLSIIEQSTPVLSDAEIRMQQQLETYQIQIDYLKDKIHRVQQFLSSNQEQGENLSMENIHNYVQNHQHQIDQMKQRLQTIQTEK